MRKIIAWISFCGIFVGASLLGGISFVEATPRLAQVGRAYQFDGVDDYVDLGNFQLINDISIEFDVKTTDISNKVLFEIGGNTGISIQTDTSSTGKLLINNGSLLRSTSIISDGFIHNIRYERVGNANSLFIDGNLENSNTNVVSFSGGTATYIGGRGTSGNVNALIGNVVIKDGNGKILHSWHGDEGVGVRSFDAVQEWTDVEIASNGGFNTDVSGFTTSRCALTWNSGGYATTTQNNVTSDNFAILKGGSHVVGKKYKITFRARSTDTTNTPAIISAHYSNIHLLKNPNLSSVWQEYEYTAIATQTAFVLYPSITAVTNGTRVDLDDISIKELHSPVHGTITNANEATFHTEDRDFVSYQNTIGYAEEVPQEELFDISTTPSVLGGSATTTYSNGIRRITGNNTAVTGTTRTNGVLPHPLELRTYKIAYDARSNTTVKITPDLVDDWPASEDRPSVTSNFVRYEYEMEAQHTTAGLDFVDWNVQKEGGGNLLATDYGEIRNVSIREVSLPGQLIPRAIDKDGNALLTDIFGNYMDGSRRAAMSDADLYLATPVAVFDGVNDYVAVGDINEEVLSGVVRFYTPTVINKSTPYKPLLNFGTDASSFLHLGALTGTLTDEIIVLGGWGTNCSYWASSTEEISAGWHTLSWAWDGTKNQLYLDGVAITTEVVATPAIINPVNFNIGTFYNGYAYFGGSLSEIHLYNRILSATEILNLHNGDQITLGLIAHYTFSEGGGDTVYDKVPEYYGPELVTNGNFSDGVSNWAIGGAGITYDVVDGKMQIAYNNTTPYGNIIQTVSTTLGKTYELTLDVFQLKPSTTNRVTIGAGSTGLNGNAPIRKSLVVGQNKLRFVSDATNAYLAVKLESGDPSITTPLIFDNISLKEVYEPAHGTVTNANLSTFWGNDDTSRSDNLLDGFSKGLQSIGTGRMYKPSSVAYGTWEFDFNFRTINDNRFYFISNTPDITVASDGYYIRGVTGGALELRLFINGSSSTVLMKTPDGYIQDNKNYKIRIERASNGAFTCYIKGDTFGEDWLLLNVSGGSGTNPATNNMFTASEYVLATLRGNDTISNLKINASPVDIHTFTNGTGSFQKVNIPAQSGNTGKDVFKNLLAQPTTVNSVVNRLRLSTLNLVTVGRRYWDTSYKKFFLGETSNSFIEFPASNYVVPQTTLNTLNTNKTAVPGRLYYDTTQRVFKKGASDGSIIDY